MSFTARNLLEIQSDPEYRNWLAVGQALLFLRDGLKKYVEHEMNALHDSISKNVGPTAKCNCMFTPGKKSNPHGRATSCSWAQELKKFHVFKNKADIPWHQSDSSKWHDAAVGHWEIAKLFMSDLGKDPTTVTDPNSTDVGPFLNLLRFCKHFKIQKSLLEPVTDRRNQWAHSPNHKLTEDDKNAAFQDIKLLMNDPELVASKDVQDFKSMINNVETADVSVLRENELRLVEEFRRIKECENLRMEEELDAANEEIKILRQRDKFINFVFITLSFLMSLHRKGPGLLTWFLTVALTFSGVGEQRGLVSDDGCSGAKMKSPISHFHYQQFDFFSHLIHKREGFVGREWFFLELENILETDRGTTGVLITGAPGSGKSALMSQLICSPYSSLLVHQNIIGYHLCEYSEKGKRDGTRFVHNLVDQIAARFPRYSEYIIKNELIRRELDIFCQKDVTGCFFTSILGPLRELKPPAGLRYIVVDALDECFNSDKTSEIIEILSSKIPHLPKWLKFILTSRNLTMVTARIPRTVRRTSLFANDERNVEDIRLYVSRFISQNSFFMDRLLIAMNLNFTSRTYGMRKFLDRVITRAEGNFLFVKTTLQYMNDTDGAVDFRSLPTSLFDLYTIFFNRQFGKDGFGSFRSLFEVLLFVASPLHLTDMEEILRNEYQEKDISYLIDEVSCFLRFGLDGTIRIYHQSFAEWLINQSAVIHINETRAHRNIAKFQLNHIRQRSMNVKLAEVIELFMHILAGNTLEKHVDTIDLFNITEIRDPRTSQTALHCLATKPRPFLPVLELFIQKFDTVDILDANKKTPAFYAASEGFVENLQCFIGRGADVSSFLDGFRGLDTFVNIVRNTGVEEYSLIHAAAAKGHKDVVELLIKNNVSVHEKNKNYPTTFHLAAGNGHIEVLQLLYNYGVKFDVISLHHAAARNRSDVVQFLLRTVRIRDTCLQCTCKPEHLSKFSVEDVHLYFCETALHAAVSRRHMDIVKRLLAFGKESLECKHHSGKTVLMDAVERNDLEMVDLLLENGANITTKCGDILSKQSKSKLCSVSSMYRDDFLYTVYCKEDSCKCGNTAIHVSAKYGSWNIAEKLTSKQVFSLTDVENCNRESALMVAISHGHTHFMHHINETYEKYSYVLNSSYIVLEAISRCSDDAVKHILEYPIHHMYERRWEFLLYMVGWNPYLQFRIGIITPNICLEAYGDGNISFREWIQRVSKKRLAIIKLLVESYEDKLFILNKKDDEGKTLFHHAVENIFDDAVKYFHQAGADTRIADRSGNNALTLALNNAAVNGLMPLNRDAFYLCYATSDGQFDYCNTTNYDEVVRYLIWLERSQFRKCDHVTASLLNKFVEKHMPLSLYELLKAGVDLNCKDEGDLRPFLKHLRQGGRQLNDVFQIFGVDIILQCGATFTSSELHLISYLALPDNLGNFFKPLKKNNSPLQSLIDKHPDGVSILNKCYDAEGYLPIHRAAQGGNLDAIKWFKSVGVDTQLKTKSGLSALDLSILYVGDISHAELIASWTDIPDSLQRSNFNVPGTISNYRKEAFDELLRMFFSATPDYKKKFPCGERAEGLSPLHMAAVKGTSVLRFVHTKVTEIFPNLPVHCANKHGLDPVYVAHFYESLLNEGLVNKYSQDFDVIFEEKKPLEKGEPRTNKKIKSGTRLERTPIDEKDIYYDMSTQFPDREVEYYMVFSYLYHSSSFEYTDEKLHTSAPNKIRVNDCPGYHDKIDMTIPLEMALFSKTDFAECSKIQVRHNFYLPLCVDEVSKNHDRKRQDCPALMKTLIGWFMSHRRRNRKISQYLSERLDFKGISEGKQEKMPWPFSFLHSLVLEKHKSWKYLMVLNEAMEVADVRFHDKYETLGNGFWNLYRMGHSTV